MKKIIYIVTIVLTCSLSLSSHAQDNPHQSADRDVMRVSKPIPNQHHKATSHSDRNKDLQLDSRRMKSQILKETKATNSGYSDKTLLNSGVSKAKHHPIKTKRMGDH